jgi:hypothetical protein
VCAARRRSEDVAIHPGPLTEDERVLSYQDMREHLNTAQEELLVLRGSIRGYEQRDQIMAVYELLETALSGASRAFGPLGRES